MLKADTRATPPSGSLVSAKPATTLAMESIRSRLLVSIREAASLSGLSRSFLYEAMARGELQFVKKGRRRLIPVTSLSEYALRSDI